nr:lysozyme [Synechococcus sp. PCC 7502]
MGYGHTQNVYPNQIITQQQAINLLDSDLSVFELGVCQAVKAPLNSNQFSALVCFTFNVSLEDFTNSTLLKLLNNSDYEGAANQLHQWVYADGQRL